jgi:hypothetical protein
MLVLIRESWQVALLAFFLAAFAGFAFAYLVGLLYRSLGSQERRDFKAATASDAPASRRVAIGAAGAVLISLTVFAIQAMIWLQSGAGPSMPTKVLLGFLAFFIVGAGCLLSIYIGRHRAT